jgi:hypothetical protein
MKKLILILFCLTLTASAVRAPTLSVHRDDNYTLLATFMYDSDPHGPDGPVPPTVYILQYPRQTRRPVVFKTFGSALMEAALFSLPRGSVVVFYINTWDHVIPPAQVPQFETLKAKCKEKGVSLTVPDEAD